jgi:DNA-binding transcriptional regulator YdaS (Cro superfamily)
MTSDPLLETSTTKAVRAAGSQAQLRRLLDVPQSTLNSWLRRKMELPPQHVLKVERSLGIPRHELRPDIYPLDNAAPPPLAQQPAGQPPASAPCPPSAEEAGGTVVADPQSADPLEGMTA